MPRSQRFCPHCSFPTSFRQTLRRETIGLHATLEKRSPPLLPEPRRALVLSSHTPGVNGHWFKAFSVRGGKSYQFSAYRIAENVESERGCSVRIEWYGSDGKLVESPHKVNPNYLGGDTDMARPDYPRDRERLNNGSVLVQDTYIACESHTCPRAAASPLDGYRQSDLERCLL